MLNLKLFAIGLQSMARRFRELLLPMSSSSDLRWMSEYRLARG